MEQFYTSPLGNLKITVRGGKIIALGFVTTNFLMCEQDPFSNEADECVLEMVRLWLDKYFSGRNPGDTPPIDFVHATDYQKRVWCAVKKIPYGETSTYKAIAKTITCGIDCGYSPRAVGAALNRNPVALIVPCHRVIGARGDLVGYAYGLDKKAALLALEQGSPLTK